MRTLLVDNYDSYSYNLYQLIASCYGVAPTVVTNDSARWSEINLDDYDAVFVSPGPGRPQARRDTGVAFDYICMSATPVLGVCLGHQALGWVSGADVIPAPQPRHGHLERIRHTGTDLFFGIPQDFVAVRYHSLCLAEPLPPQVEATAWATDGVVMGMRHREHPWWGVQFHPESVATEHGTTLLDNFRRLVRARRQLSTGTAVSSAPRRIVTQLSVDFVVPTETLFTELFADRPYAFWLDSSRVENGLSRFSFLGEAGGECGEVFSARVGTGAVQIRDADGSIRHEPGSIFDVLEERLRCEPSPAYLSLPFDLVCGYVGYFGYEMKAECGSSNVHVAEQPDAWWMTASRMIAVDHENRRCWVLALGMTDPQSVSAARRWVDHTAKRLAELRGTPPRDIATERADTRAEPWLDRPQEIYLADIDACKQSLRVGESYEICLTNTVDIPFTGSPLDLYLHLRRCNPAPYAAFLRFDEVYVLSSSPERFLKIDSGRRVESKPIKGTVPRQSDSDLDRRARDQLAMSEKTRAENLMIVDLLRNDLGRVCEINTVTVPRFMHVESYATVHHLVSTVRGQLRAEVNPVAAVRACFPGGSMTGAPKLRTMEIIDTLEKRARGIYSGTLGFFGFQGVADLSIVIRTAVIASGRLTVGAGGAIVLDSDAGDEFDEMTVKAESVLQALPAGEVPLAARQYEPVAEAGVRERDLRTETGAHALQQLQ